MKKILKILFCFCLFITFKTIEAAEQNYITLGSQIPGVRLYLKTPTVEKYKGMFLIYNQTTGEPVYCIEPGVVLKNGSFTAYPYLDMIPKDLGITEDDWNYLRTIAYYGYGYRERTDLKWYAATQFMIWEYILKDTGEIYFVDQNNQKIDYLKDEIDCIQKDLDAHNLLPSFLEDGKVIDVRLGDTITLVDQYEILDEFEISYSNVDVVRNGNEVSISFQYPGYQYVGFNRQLESLKIPKIFYSPSSQTVMAKGIISRPYQIIEFNVQFPTITLIKKSSEDALLSLKGAKYNIYYLDGVHYQTIETNENGIAYLDRIDLGEYYLQEVEAPYGYELNDEKIYFEVTQDDIVIEVENTVIKKEIVIEKYLEDLDGNLELEKNAKFQVYDQNNQLVLEFQTNEYGKYTLSLPYGEYTLKQITSSEGYSLAENITLTVNENTSDNLIIKNPQIVGSLMILKLDSESKEEILDEAVFKIYDVGRHKYFKVDGKDEFSTVDGKIVIEKIPYGDYQLIEVEAPSHYLPLEGKVDFSIKSDEAITLEVVNELKKGVLTILKQDALNNDIILDEATFKIYDVDHQKYFQVNENEEFKTIDGKIVIKEIPYGNYLLIEIDAPTNYLPLKEPIAFSINPGEEITLEVKNELQKGSLEIEKIDDETLKPLQGVLFGLYNQDQNLIQEYTTDENGKITIPDLLEGIYYIKELATLDGYHLLDGFMEVNVKNNVLSTFKVTNRLKVEVPKTGVNELLCSILFSSFCLMIGMALCNYDKNH